MASQRGQVSLPASQASPADQRAVLRGIYWLGSGLGSIIAVLLLPAVLAISFGIDIISVEAIRIHFEPDMEGNFFTWYSSLLLLLTAGSAFLNGWLESQPVLGPVTSSRFLWPFIGVIPLLLSMDEVAQIHESVGNVMSLKSAQHPASDFWNLFSKPHHASVLVYLPGIVTALAFLLLAFRRLFAGQHRPFWLACASLVLWCSVFPLEYFHLEWADFCGVRCNVVEVIVEEGCELLGSLGLFLAFLLRGQARLARHHALVSTSNVPVPEDLCNNSVKE